MEYKSELETLKNRYEKLREYYYSNKGKRDQLLEQKSKVEESLKSTAKYMEVLEKSRVLLQKVSEFAREQARERIESLVTDCLQYIFESDIEFKIEINEVRGKPEAEFFVLSRINGETVKTKPQEARGGGVVDIISLALRIAMLQSGSLAIKGPIILDEPAKHVSDEYIVRVAEFLKHISTSFDRQIVMVTHNRHLSEIADKSFKVEMVDGISHVGI